jgi:hypothetical protein
VAEKLKNRRSLVIGVLQMIEEEGVINQVGYFDFTKLPENIKAVDQDYI